MLEHVALNQTRFNTPGVQPDNRGIVLGKQGALLFASIDRLVAFFRVFCDESTIDDVLPKLKIQQVQSPVGSRELLVMFHAASSYLVDRAARVAGLVGGLAFTGSGKHYVKYRDNASPLGYDVRALASAEHTDVVLYGDTFTQGYTRIKDVGFDQLVFRLSLRRIPGHDHADRELLWLVVKRGLISSVLTYLWRNRVRGEAAQAQPTGGTFAERQAMLLVRVHELPERMLALFEEMPGVDVHRPIGETCLVQVGYRHPLRLESCASVFEKDKLYVFAGGREAVQVLSDLPPLVPIHDLMGGGYDLGERPEPLPMKASAPEKLEVELKLVASPSARRRVTATLVSWAQAAWLRRLVYALPPTLLASYRVAAVADGLFIIGEQGVDGIPIGEMFQEAAPSIYVPLAHEFQPRVSQQVLTDHVGGVAGRYVVFRRGLPAPLALEHALFDPLGRRALARLEVEARSRDPRMPPARTVTPATVVNENTGAFPLWGFRSEG
jgi:hypothetical protein